MRKFLFVLFFIFLVLNSSSFALNSEEAANESVKVAKWFYVNQKDTLTGNKFIKYALARDSDNRSALLVQAKVEKNRFESIDNKGITKSSLERFKRYLEQVAKNSKNPYNVLLHYKMISFIEIGHEDALVELTYAKNQGKTTDFQELMDAVFKKKLPTSGKAEYKPKYFVPKGRNPTNREIEAMAVATINGNIDLVKRYVTAVPKLAVQRNAQTYVTPLHWAASQGHEEIVDYLIEHGALVNAKDGQGQTSLHYAAVKGHNSIISKLAENGAFLEPLNRNNQTPAQVAIINNHRETAELIQQLKK